MIFLISPGMVLFTITTAPLFGLTWMVNSLPLTSALSSVRVTVKSTCSPGSNKSLVPMIHLVDHEQLGEPLPVQLMAASSSR